MKQSEIKEGEMKEIERCHFCSIGCIQLAMSTEWEGISICEDCARNAVAAFDATRKRGARHRYNSV